MDKVNVSGIIVAAGSSSRMGGINKQLELIDGIPVVVKSALALNNCPSINEIIIATRPEDIDIISNLCKDFGVSKLSNVVAGGDTRMESVRNAISAVSEHSQYIAIHDGARPLVTSEDIERVISDAKKHNAAALGVPVKDTIKQVGKKGFIEDTPPRQSLFIAQTPQVFKLSLYLDAMGNATKDITDDCQLIENMGESVFITRGNYSNIKLTTPEDFQIGKALIGENSNEDTQIMRIGNGYDVHRLVNGRELILGGVNIPFEKGLLGHSDADVLCHAISDSLLGAAALGDIGKHFPDNDENYKDANSIDLLEKVVDLVEYEGYLISNIDATISAQLPKLAPYIEQMRRNIADACDIDIADVSIKATTQEELGFVGRGEGISTFAVCLLKGI